MKTSVRNLLAAVSGVLSISVGFTPIYAAAVPQGVTDTFTWTNTGGFSPTKTTGGYALSVTFKEQLKAIGTNIISVSGFKANPGASWINNISCTGSGNSGGAYTYTETLSETKPYVTFTYNGTTTTGGVTPTYTFSGMTATWEWGATQQVLDANAVTCNLTYGGTGGVILPKWEVVGLTYAPPGSKSTATYASGFMSGTSTSTASSFANDLSVVSKLATGLDLFGFVDATVTTSLATDWAQEADSTYSLTLSEQYTSGLIVPGPPLATGNIDQGVDHDYDTVYVWINPASLIIFTGSAAVFGGSYYDDRDGMTNETCDGQTYAGVTGMDVVPLTIGQLKGTQPITDPCLLVRLSRPWDPYLGGLTQTDYQAIAASDPFYLNPQFNPNTDTSGRYDVPLHTTSFPFVPGSATHVYSANYTSTSVAGKSAKSTYSVAFTLAGEASASFLASVAANFSVTDKVTYTNTNSSTITKGTNQSISFSVVPPATGTYNGATQIQVWKDNIYGTFLFFPEN